MTEAQKKYYRDYHRRRKANGGRPLRGKVVAKSVLPDRIDETISQLSSVIGILRVMKALTPQTRSAVIQALSSTER